MTAALGCSHVSDLSDADRLRYEPSDFSSGSKLAVTQLTANARLDDPTLVDAVLDCVAHAPHRIAVSGSKSVRAFEAKQ